MAILSIQSHVVYGYAGNTAAVFPMQRLGREVWAINTVEFSNHTGYGSWKGKVLGGELAEELVAGLEERGVLPQCEAVLSGYMGDAAVGRAITGAVRKVRSAAPRALYCCDPVMGDIGRGFYVKPDIPDIFRNELVPLADIITPNQFELEALTGVETRDIDSTRQAIDMIHEKGPSIVLVTSYHDGKAGEQAGKRPGDERRIGMLASDKSGVYSISTPELPIGTGMAGSGDITASVFLSRYLETGDVKKTLELCTASIYGIIEASWQVQNGKVFSQLGEKFSPNSEKTYKHGTELMELRIIQAQNELDTPTHAFEARRL
jgi:pyridoxine kinase